MGDNDSTPLWQRCLEPHVPEIRQALARREVTIYLGAGVSMGSGLPSWEQLVLAMYYQALSGTDLHGWRPFPNYLFAIAEYHLRHSAEPPDITAQKLLYHYGREDHGGFFADLKVTLYSPFAESGSIQLPEPSELRAGNTTLGAIASLCEIGAAAGDMEGVESVVSYNYDDLLEQALGPNRCTPLWNPAEVEPGKLPIYHVHGFVPGGDGPGSEAGEIVFTEEQYHKELHNPYSWGSLVQLRAMSSTVGLMIGLSLTDRNMRRLLDAVSRSGLHGKSYVFLQRPSTEPIPAEAVAEIDDNARAYMDTFLRAGAKTKGEGRMRREVQGIVQAVQKVDQKETVYVLEQLGVSVIWYENHSDISDAVALIMGQA